MTFDNSIKTCLSNSFTFAGRASRSEYWYFTLFALLLALVGILLHLVIEDNYYWGLNPDIINIATLIIMVLCGLCLIPASISVTVRRFHDINRSGWNLWWGIIPYIGSLIVLFFMVQPSQAGNNQYGSMPE